MFFRSRHSLGIVNLKPIVPGHVLVISKRVVARFGDLTTDEVSWPQAAEAVFEQEGCC